VSLLDFRREGKTSKNKQDNIWDAGYVVIDTELTGLNGRKDSIVSIGALRMTGGRIDIGNTFYRLVNPEATLTAESVIIHQILPADVLKEPDIKTVLSEFIRFCGRNIIIGYCVNIDMEFLNREMKRLYGSSLANPVLDVMVIFEWMRSRDMFRGDKKMNLPSRYQLYDIARYFDIPVNGAHNALIDAFITAQIFQRFMPVLAGAGIKSIGDLPRLSCIIEGGGRDTINHIMSNF
jgi:DNA polymerase-3 subunit epsilon